MDRGFVLITGENTSQDELPAGRHFRQRVGHFVEPPWYMIELQAIEPIL
jgi:hypothetical protein